jgi:hypothetical protein
LLKKTRKSPQSSNKRPRRDLIYGVMKNERV